MNRTCDRKRRGAALLEFVMCIPLLALIIAATFFFGMVMRNEQQLCVTDRYHAWRTVHNSDASVDMNDQAHKLYGEPDEGAEHSAYCQRYKEINVQDPSGDFLNEYFFLERAERVTVSHHGGTRDTLDELEEAALEKGGVDAGSLVEEAMDTWPHGSVSRVDAVFPKEQEMLENIVDGKSSSNDEIETRVYYRRGYRDGVQWRRGQSSYLEPIRKLFLYKLDDAVETIPNSTIRDNLQTLYREHW